MGVIYKTFFRLLTVFGGAVRLYGESSGYGTTRDFDTFPVFSDTPGCFWGHGISAGSRGGPREQTEFSVGGGGRRRGRKSETDDIVNRSDGASSPHWVDLE